MQLYLCEKPSQARDIARELGATRRDAGCQHGPGVAVTWGFGHLLAMAPPGAYDEQLGQWRRETLPILPRQWQLQVRPKAKEQYHIVRRLLSQADEVVLATDADREGETIGREILDHAGYRGPVRRLWLSALDPVSIRQALAQLLDGSRTEPLYQAGLARSRADWLIGMNLTRAFTLTAQQRGHQGVLSVGRVQTPTLRLVVERDRAIEQFRPHPYYEVHVQCRHAQGAWTARWHPTGKRDSEGRCIDRSAAQAAAERTEGAEAQVTRAQTERHQASPPLPLDLSSLQQAGDQRWGDSAQEVLDAAQALYERHKAITYPRTDCRYLPTSQQVEATQVLQALASSDPSIQEQVEGADPQRRSRAWNDEKITAHHAIIPTGAAIDVSAMNQRERRLYELIRAHYLAQFYPPCEYDEAVIEVATATDTFVAKGRSIRVSGWRAVLGQDRAGEQEQPLPPVHEQDPVRLDAAELQERETKPPRPYTAGTLLAAMKRVADVVEDPQLRKTLKETSGIGTEATRAGIIETLQQRGYLVRRKRALRATEAGRALIDAVPEEVSDPATTARWEEALGEIADGRGDMAAFLEQQAAWVHSLVRQVQNTGSEAIAIDGAETHACPSCGRPMRRRKGKHGAFWGCSGYPDCTVTRPDANGRPAEPKQNRPVGECGCGGTIYAKARAWQCDTCQARVWHETAGKKLTERQAQALLAGQTVHLRGLRSRKTGKRFDAPARVEQGQLKLIFEQRR